MTDPSSFPRDPLGHAGNQSAHARPVYRLRITQEQPAAEISSHMNTIKGT